MYWSKLKDGSKLSPEQPDFHSVIKYLDDQYRLRLADKLKEYPLDQQNAPIRSIKREQLRFYKKFSDPSPLGGQNPHDSNSSESKSSAQAKPPELFEVELDLSAIDERYSDKTLTNYEWTRVYVVRVPKDNVEDEAKSSTHGYEWYLLDGESTVLHTLNAKFGGINVSDPLLLKEYLDFFCSFLRAAEGVFVHINDAEELTGLDDENQFEMTLFESRHFIVHQKPKRFPDELRWDRVEPTLGERLGELGDTTLGTDKASARLKGIVLYGREFFESTFDVNESGKVEMTEDKRIFMGARGKIRTDLAVRSFAIITLPDSGLILFSKSDTRKRKSAADFMDLMSKARDGLSLSNLLIVGDITFRPWVKLQGVECFNVQFLGDVKFDHCQVSSVLRFSKCQFLGAFSAPGTRFQSQLALKNSDIFALPRLGDVRSSGTSGAQVKIERPGEDEGGYAIALKLDHARVEGSLSLERLTAHGSVQGRQLSVMADANFCGLQVLPLVDSTNSEENEKESTRKLYKAASANGPVVLDLQRSSFAGSLNLGIWTDSQEKVKGSKNWTRTRVTVCGDCRFDTMSVGKSLIIEGLAVVRPKTEVDLERLPYGDWNSTLYMTNVMVKGNIQSWDYDSWDPTGRAISPPLLVDGDIDLKWSTIAGYVDLRTSHIGKKLDCDVMRAAWLTLEPSRVDAISADMKPQEAGEIDWVNYSLSAVPEPKVVGNAPADWIDQFKRRMSIINGGLKLGNAIIPGGVTLIGTTIGGTVDVRLGARLGQIKVLPAFCVCNASEAGVPASRKVVKQDAFLGGLSIRDSTIAGPVYLWGAQVGKEDAGGQNAAPRPVIDIVTSELEGGLYLHARSNWEGQQIASELLDAGKHWNDDKATSTDWVDHQGLRAPTKNNFKDMASNYFWQTFSDIFHTTVKGDVDVLASDIGADVDLTNTEVEGRVRLNDSYVRCDVRAVACLQELDAKDKAPPQSEQRDALHTALKTTCTSFEFQSLRCDGDLMLAGLVTAADVDGRNAVVRGHGEFNCDWIVADPTLLLKSTMQKEKNGRASIKGNLELCGCEIGLLRIDGQSFEGKDKTEIDLSRATLSTLKLFAPLPKHMNLQSIKVDHWDIGNGKKETELLELLNATKDHYDSWPYKSIENSLTAQGEDDVAKAVFVSKNWAEWHVQEGSIREEISEKSRQLWGWPIIACILFLVASMATSIWPWSQFVLLGATASLIWFLSPMIPLIGSWLWHRSVKKWIWGKFMGFGTVLGGAVLVWALLSLGLVFMLSDPHNAQPTFAAVNSGLGKINLGTDNAQEVGSGLQKARNELQKQFPQGREWGFRNALWLALDITVPLVPFNLHEEWEPRESTEGTVMPCCLYGELLMAPKTFANISTLLSWIIWTLIATALASVMWARK